MIMQKDIRPKVITPKKVITTHTALVESYETKEQCFERVKKQFNITDAQLESGEVKINLLKN